MAAGIYHGRVSKVPLERLVFRHYARSALVAILTIETLLLAGYVAVNSYMIAKTEEALKNEVEQVMPHLVSQYAEAVNKNLSFIARQAKFFAEEHASLFAHPEAFLSGGSVR